MAESSDSIREKFHKLMRERPAENHLGSAVEWEPVISIGTAASKVGLSVSALRKYEKEGLLLYHRSESGRRLLCQADIKRIRLIKHMINDLGLNLEGIRRLLALLPCWDLKLCSADDKKNCKAVRDSLHPCWMVSDSECLKQGYDCRQCEVYRYGAYCAVTMKLLLHRLNDVTDN
jgi:MerR family transcriptional regulator/heat shock protein HspR